MINSPKFIIINLKKQFIITFKKNTRQSNYEKFSTPLKSEPIQYTVIKYIHTYIIMENVILIFKYLYQTNMRQKYKESKIEHAVLEYNIIVLIIIHEHFVKQWTI